MLSFVQPANPVFNINQKPRIVSVNSQSDETGLNIDRCFKNARANDVYSVLKILDIRDSRTPFDPGLDSMKTQLSSRLTEFRRSS